jgi:hypothetical protein
VLLFLEATKGTAVVGYDGSIAFNADRKALALRNLAVEAVDPV